MLFHATPRSALSPGFAAAFPKLRLGAESIRELGGRDHTHDDGKHTEHDERRQDTDPEGDEYADREAFS